ncbi:hypothetical protein [Roseicyclus mahoneyensis]|uniref:Uncharacterized protein n=1 Tax=Roseicyclus mahoneyensis TaxID=164332 RepID=A0A316GED0_9RHOB|nr:hypothetical protein [Roseicyclus mahoneyensis]PWK59351.1 hypothetical protein C7455_108119 [Roseicyclus mahoneyensis]
MTFPRALALATAFCMSALPAAAQSQLDRMQVVSERANTLMNEAMIIEIPALAGNMPDPTWDDPMRTAYACILDGYVAASSTGAVDSMLDEMEALLEDATADSILNGDMAEDAMLPEGVDEAQAQAILMNCGLMELMMTRMAESGAMGVMMQQSQ